MNYRRILLKLSGESLGGSSGTGLDSEALDVRVNDIVEAHDMGFEIGIVPGGGNIFRGIHAGDSGVDRMVGDQMGMLATVMNALAIQNRLTVRGIESEIWSSIPIGSFVRPFNAREVREYLRKKHVGIFPGGTGNPYFTTDTAAALRALEISADVLLKGPRVDGVYTADPEKDKNARLYRTISFDTVLEQKLAVMDLTAITLCRENDLPVVVFNQNRAGSMKRVLMGEDEGTTVRMNETTA